MRYRSRVMFRIRSYCLPYFHWISNQRYSGYLVSSFSPSRTGLSPSTVQLSSWLLVRKLGWAQVQTPHLLYVSIQDSVCPIPFSIAFTKGIAIALFSSTYFDVSVRWVPLRLLRMTYITIGQEVSFGYPGVEANMRLTQAYRSLSRPSSVVLPRHPLHSLYAANYSSRSISPTKASWNFYFS